MNNNKPKSSRLGEPEHISPPLSENILETAAGLYSAGKYAEALEMVDKLFKTQQDVE